MDATRTANDRWDLATLIDRFRVTFDPGDKANGSLYLCTATSSARAERLAIARLREHDAWSSAEPKQIEEDQKSAYKAQLQFVEARGYNVAGETIVLLRCDHPKFPSDANRWTTWNQGVQSLADVNAS